MNVHILVILLLSSLAAATNFDYLNDHLVINQLKNNQVEHPEMEHFTTRASRTQGTKIRFCGRRLYGFIFATCGECQPGLGIDLSSLCCSQQCDIQDVIDACCPDLPFRR